MKNNYDYIIAGSGGAGLSVAYYLNKSKLKNRQVLLIDRDQKTKNDRTWSFWTETPTAFDAIVHKRWEKIRFSGVAQEYTHQLKEGTSYQQIKSADFYQFTKAAIAANPNFEQITGDITQIGEDTQGAFVIVNGQEYRADWIFNSCLNLQQWQQQTAKHPFLLQHFRGWVVQMDEPVFEPSIAHLMDFRTRQHDNARFFYLLPFSENKALIEYTIFSDQLLAPSDYETALRQYLTKHWKTIGYTIIETESGIIPMTDAPLPPTPGKHIIPIGTPGGAIKPTTGYAFLNIQKQTQQLIAQLEQGLEPNSTLPNKKRFRFYDRLLLNILHNEGASTRLIFSRLFQKNPIDRIFRFLDERTTLWQEILILFQLPIRPFLRAIRRTYFPTKPSAKRISSISILTP